MKECEELCNPAVYPEFNVKYKLSVEVLSPSFLREPITIFLPPDVRLDDSEDYSDVGSFEPDTDSCITLNDLRLVRISEVMYVGYVVSILREATHTFSLLGEHLFSRTCKLR